MHKLKISENLGDPMHASKQLRIAIIGAGLGGATCAILFERSGFHTDVYEQAPAFTRLGAGIHLGPNCVRVFNHIGIGKNLLEFVFSPKPGTACNGIPANVSSVSLCAMSLSSSTARHMSPFIAVTCTHSLSTR